MSNRGVDDQGRGGGAAGPADAQRVWGPRFDVLVLAANRHCEHHDFPKVPLWNLPELKRRAGAEFPASPPWYDVLRGAVLPNITHPRCAALLCVCRTIARNQMPPAAARPRV